MTPEAVTAQNIGFFMGIIPWGGLAMFVTFELLDAKWRKEAVKQGKAEFYLDENHKRQWRWKEGQGE